MRCPHCGIEVQRDVRKDYTKPLFAILILLLIAFFLVGIRMRGENEALKSNIGRLEKKVAYYEATLLQYQKVIDQFTRNKSDKK
jgi:hypothetical protein